jgi:hypothetical protein
MRMRFKKEVEHEYFKKDFSKLVKKYKTLADDFKIFKTYSLEPFLLDNVNNKCSERISKIGIVYPEIWKVKKFTSRSFKGKGVKSGFRIIYAYYRDLEKIIYIEIYHKTKKTKEDRERIKTIIKKNN